METVTLAAPVAAHDNVSCVCGSMPGASEQTKIAGASTQSTPNTFDGMGAAVAGGYSFGIVGTGGVEVANVGAAEVLEASVVVVVSSPVVSATVSSTVSVVSAGVSAGES